MQHDFPKMREGGSRAVWNFSENSSVFLTLTRSLVISLPLFLSLLHFLPHPFFSPLGTKYFPSGLLLTAKGQVTIPKRMNFWKGSKNGGGHHFQSKKSCCRFWTLKKVFLFDFPEKNCHMIFRKRGGGQRQGCLGLFRKFIRFGIVTSNNPRGPQIFYRYNNDRKVPRIPYLWNVQKLLLLLFLIGQ